MRILDKPKSSEIAFSGITSDNSRDVLDLLRAEALSQIRGVLPEGTSGDRRDFKTTIPYFSIIRMTRPTELSKGILTPSMCMVIQGKKKILIGKSIFQYEAGSYVLSTLDIPVSGQVIEATHDVPYLGLRRDYLSSPYGRRGLHFLSNRIELHSRKTGECRD